MRKLCGQALSVEDEDPEDSNLQKMSTANKEKIGNILGVVGEVLISFINNNTDLYGQQHVSRISTESVV